MSRSNFKMQRWIELFQTRISRFKVETQDFKVDSQDFNVEFHSTCNLECHDFYAEFQESRLELKIQNKKSKCQDLISGLNVELNYFKL